MMDTSLEKMVSESVKKILLRSEKRESRTPEFGDSAASFFELKSANTRSLFLRRNIVSVFMFLAYMMAILLRSNASIAVVDMTSERTVQLVNESTVSVSADFNWTSEECGWIFSVFSFGQMVFSMPAGWLGNRYGAVKVTGITGFVAGSLTMMTPALIDSQKLYTMLGLRFLIGLLTVVTMVNMTDVAARWIPSDEQSRVVGVSMAGVNFGTALSYILSGILAYFWRWPAVFYVTGLIAVIWAVLWLGLIRECPEEDPWISAHELAYLSRKLTPRNHKKTYPWKKILTNKPVIALCAYRCANGLDATFLRQLIPLYVVDVLRLDVGTTGLLTCLIVIPSIVSMYITGVVKDHIQNREFLSRSQTTTILMTLGTVLSTMMQFAISFLTNHTYIIVCLFLCPFSSGLVSVVSNVNSLELSSEFASIISGMGSMSNTLSQIIGPVFYGLVVTEHKASQWSILLCGFSIVELGGLVLFLIYGSTEEQHFDESNDDCASKSSYLETYTPIR